MKKTLHLILLVLCIYLCATSVNSVYATDFDLMKLIPEDENIAEWVRDGDTYIATDEESLSMYINGAAPFYIERGAVEVAFQDFAKEDVYLTLEIYRMQDEERAKQLYAEITTEEPKVLEEIGTEGRLAEGLIGAYLVEYWHETFFVRLTIAEKSEQAKEIILEFAKTVFGKIQAAM